MKADTRVKGVAILASAGLLLSAVVPFLFYGIVEPSSRSNTFLFTTWLSTGQVIILFSALIYTAIKDGHSGSVIPVNSATVLVAFLYNVAATLTMLLFTLFLLPHRSSTPRIYYVVCIAELGIAGAYAILLQLVAVAHRIGHSEAAEHRTTVESLVRKCDIVSSVATSNGWTLDIRRCSELIRFSEGLRRNPALSTEVDRLLSQLEVMTQAPSLDTSLADAKKLICSIEALAARHQ
jgi:hypothetical protein